MSLSTSTKRTQRAPSRMSPVARSSPVVHGGEPGERSYETNPTRETSGGWDFRVNIYTICYISLSYALLCGKNRTLGASWSSARWARVSAKRPQRAPPQTQPASGRIPGRAAASRTRALTKGTRRAPPPTRFTRGGQSGARLRQLRYSDIMSKILCDGQRSW